MSKPNPVDSMNEQWHKILAILMHKSDMKAWRFRAEDINQLAAELGEGVTVILLESGNEIIVKLVSGAEANEAITAHALATAPRPKTWRDEVTVGWETPDRMMIQHRDRPEGYVVRFRGMWLHPEEDMWVNAPAVPTHVFRNRTQADAALERAPVPASV